MAEKQKLNKPLFSQHFLDHRLQECLEWQIDATPNFETLQNLYSSKRDILPTLNETQTEELFIKPVLEIMGFSYIPQVKTNRGDAGLGVPRYNEEIAIVEGR